MMSQADLTVFKEEGPNPGQRHSLKFGRSRLPGNAERYFVFPWSWIFSPDNFPGNDFYPDTKPTTQGFWSKFRTYLFQIL